MEIIVTGSTPRENAGRTDRASAALEQRAVDAAMWGMPIITVDAMRRAFVRDAALKKGDIVYWSTAAHRSPGIVERGRSLYYAHLTFSTRKGPLVLDVPATAGAVVSGSLTDAWQMPQVEIGVEGEDRGMGGRYLLLPPGYSDNIPDGHIPVRFGTHDGSALVRCIAASQSARDDARAVALVKALRLYPLEDAAKPPAQRHVDIAASIHDGTGLAGGYQPFWPESNWIQPSNARATVFNGRRSSDLAQNIGRYERSPAVYRGPAPVYVFSMRDTNQEWLDGSNTYRLRIPPKAPTTQFWCVTAYDLETADVLRNTARSEVNSLHRTVLSNQDGAVDVLFGPVKPCGMDVNWLGTMSGRRWFSAFRLYGPDHGLLEGSWRLPDIERIA